MTTATAKRPAATRAKATADKLPKTVSFVDLVNLFQPRAIRNEAEYDRTVAVMDKLVLRNDLSRGELDYLNILTLLIEAYDREHYDFSSNGGTPLERLKGLMEETGTSSTQLGDIIGSRPAASMILNGQRQLSKTHIRRLSERYKLDAGYFL